MQSEYDLIYTQRGNANEENKRMNEMNGVGVMVRERMQLSFCEANKLILWNGVWM